MKTIKLFCLIFILLLTAKTYSQRYTTKTGHIWFRSEAPLEDIEAHNNQVNATLDTKSGFFVFNILMKSFIFEKAIMQEDFNKNYVESDKYPVATFEGKVSNINTIDFTKPEYMLPNSYDVEISGEITIHGITKNIDATGVFYVKPGIIQGKSKFYILLTDYKIRLSGNVYNKVALKIEINVDIHLKDYNK